MNSSRISEQVKVIIQTAKELETVGKYEEAVVVLSPYWTNITERPDVSELDKEEQAEILLRCGSLAGYIGGCKQTKHAQEFSKKLLVEAGDLFSMLGVTEKVAECETYSAISYLRTGEPDEARIRVNLAFQHKIAENSETRLHTYIINNLILLAERKYVDLIYKCRGLEKLFRSSSYYVLQGNFNNTYAVALMRIDEKERAIKRFNLAKSFYQKTKHYLYLAALENNVAILYETEEQYKEAHKSVKAAIEIFKKLGDKSHEGYSIDTQAHIYMSEGKYVEALACANEAVKILSDGEKYLYLENSLQTKSHIQLYLKDYSGLMETTTEAIRIVNLFSDKPDKRISTVKETISSNFQKCWTVDELAETIKLSKSRFKELFRQKTQLSPIQFVRHLRFEKVKELLETTHLTVKEIGFAVGINDQSGFVRDFKKKYGLTPTEYRKSFKY
jgi:AraC-like DNA-binding protein